MEATPMVNGETLLFATAGDPVRQVRLPEVMERVFAALGVNAVWMPMHADARGLVTVLEGLRTIRNFRGITVAIPHKPRALEMVDTRTRMAEAAGGINLVRCEPDGRLHGDIADGAGFVRGLERAGLSPRGATAWVVGVGGGGGAVAAALADAGVDRLYLTEIDDARITAMIARLARHYPSVRVERVTMPPGRVDFAINASPCGLQPDDPLPFDPGPLADDTVVCDIIMKPKDTKLLLAAAARGLRVRHGHHMLDCQIPLYLDFFGIPYADEDEVIAVSRAA